MEVSVLLPLILKTLTSFSRVLNRSQVKMECNSASMNGEFQPFGVKAL